MKKVNIILTFGILLAIILSPSLKAQNQANALATVTATVISSVGVEIQKEAMKKSHNNIPKSEIVLKVVDSGKYSLQIVDEIKGSVIDTKILDDKNFYHIKEELANSKKIIQISVLSS